MNQQADTILQMRKLKYKNAVQHSQYLTDLNQLTWTRLPPETGFFG